MSQFCSVNRNEFYAKPSLRIVDLGKIAVRCAGDRGELLRSDGEFGLGQPMLAGLYLDEDQLFTLKRNDVDLAMPGLEAMGKDRISLRCEILNRS